MFQTIFPSNIDILQQNSSHFHAAQKDANNVMIYILYTINEYQSVAFLKCISIVLYCSLQHVRLLDE